MGLLKYNKTNFHFFKESSFYYLNMVIFNLTLKLLLLPAIIMRHDTKSTYNRLDMI
jgi:hypothetical protein